MGRNKNVCNRLLSTVDCVIASPYSAHGGSSPNFWASLLSKIFQNSQKRGFNGRKVGALQDREAGSTRKLLELKLKAEILLRLISASLLLPLFYL